MLPLPPEIVLLYGEMDKAEGRRSTEVRYSIAQGETLGYREGTNAVALKGNAVKHFFALKIRNLRGWSGWSPEPRDRKTLQTA